MTSHQPSLMMTGAWMSTLKRKWTKPMTLTRSGLTRIFLLSLSRSIITPFWTKLPLVWPWMRPMLPMTCAKATYKGTQARWQGSQTQPTCKPKISRPEQETYGRLMTSICTLKQAFVKIQSSQVITSTSKSTRKWKKILSRCSALEQT